MAYQDFTAPSQVLNREITATRNFARRLGAAFAVFGRALMENSSMQRRVDRVASLQAKSDDELARLNIKRDEIVHHVFRDLLYV